MLVHLTNNVGGILPLDVASVVIPMWDDESENIAISVLDDGEVLVVRHGKGYPDGGECVYSELPPLKTENREE